jgi:uncharacterized membrane protein (UPF0127 family)
MANKELTIKYNCANSAMREEGLMRKPPLKDDECAFFIFPHEQMLSFWNKNVDFDIYVMFADENFTIRNCEILKAQQVHPVKSASPCKYVIEVNKDFFGNIGEYKQFVLTGDKVVLLKDKDRNNNFGKDNFQKIANQYFKYIK